MEQEMLAEARAEADAELAGGAGPAVIVTGQRQMASRHCRPARLAAEGSCAAPGFRHRLQPQRRRHRLGPLGVRASTSAGWCAGAFERGLIVKGGGHAMAAGITVERGRLGELAGLFEEQRGRRSPAPARRGDACRSTRRCRPKARRRTCSTRWSRPVRSAPAIPRRCSSLPRHQLRDVRPVGSGHLRVDLRSRCGGRVQAMAFRAVGTDLGDFLEEPGSARACRRPAAGELLERRAQRAVPDRRRGPEPAVSWPAPMPSRENGLQPRRVRRSLLGRLVADLGSPRRRGGIPTGRYGRASAAATGPADRRQAWPAKCDPG